MKKKNALIALVLYVGTIALYSQCNKKSIFELKPDDFAQKVDVYVDIKLFTSYIYPDNIKKPVLWPVVSEGGNILTRSYPIKNKEGDRIDHPHHVGVWFNYGDVNGLDFWNNSEARPPKDSALRICSPQAGVECRKQGQCSCSGNKFRMVEPG